MSGFEFETDMLLDEFGIEVPDRCKACPRLAGIVTKLATAHGNKAFLTTALDEEVLKANMRSQLTEQVLEHYPDATDEQIDGLVNGSISHHLSSEGYTDFLKRTGEFLEIEDNTVNDALLELSAQVSACPPAGCNS